MPRPFAGAPDLVAMQQSLAEWRSGDPCGHLHPGDVAHRIYNGLRRHDPGRNVRIWEDGGSLAGFVLVYPPWNAFDYEHQPGREDVAHGMLDWAERELAVRATGDGQLATEAWDCDAGRPAVLEARGFARDKPTHAVTGRALEGIAEARLPDGFSIRQAAGPGDAAALAAVHAGSFRSTWTEAEYSAHMATPGYDPARELVVVAPDGRFAAFCIIWLDERNAEGLFEPVGTHEDFRRLGLARALLHEGMRRMQAAGMRAATVLHDADDEPSGRLYASAGFELQAMVFDYAKTR